MKPVHSNSQQQPAVHDTSMLFTASISDLRHQHAIYDKLIEFCCVMFDNDAIHPYFR